MWGGGGADRRGGSCSEEYWSPGCCGDVGPHEDDGPCPRPSPSSVTGPRGDPPASGSASSGAEALCSWSSGGMAACSLSLSTAFFSRNGRHGWNPPPRGQSPFVEGRKGTSPPCPTERDGPENKPRLSRNREGTVLPGRRGDRPLASVCLAARFFHHPRAPMAPGDEDGDGTAARADLQVISRSSPDRPPAKRDLGHTAVRPDAGSIAVLGGQAAAGSDQRARLLASSSPPRVTGGRRRSRRAASRTSEDDPQDLARIATTRRADDVHGRQWILKV